MPLSNLLYTFFFLKFEQISYLAPEIVNIMTICLFPITIVANIFKTCGTVLTVTYHYSEILKSSKIDIAHIPREYPMSPCLFVWTRDHAFGSITFTVFSPISTQAGTRLPHWLTLIFRAFLYVCLLSIWTFVLHILSILIIVLQFITKQIRLLSYKN